MTTYWHSALPVQAIERPDIVFADIDEAMAATVRPVRLFVRIGGEVVDATEAHTRHGVDQMIGTCTVIIRAPRPAVVAMNAEIEIEAGYAGAVRRIFHGFIPDDESISDNRGQTVRVQGVGWASRLAYPDWGGTEITGPVSLKDAFRSLCLGRGIPTFLSDDTTYVDGVTTIMLGGNDQVDEGHIRLDGRTSPGDWLRRVPPLFGYRVFDSPDGTVRLRRVSGIPPSPTVTYETLTNGDVVTKNAVDEGSWYLFRDPYSFSSTNRIATLAENDAGRVVDPVGFLFLGYRIIRASFARHGTGYIALFDESTETYRFDITPGALTYAEGVNAYRMTRTRDRDRMVTFWEVLGARYTDADGGPVQIRSIPDAVPYAEELDPPGYIHRTLSSQDLVTSTQAEGARNVMEVDHSEVYEEVTWTCAGRPDLQPGDVVLVTGASHDLTARPVWVMAIDQGVTDRGYIASRITGWRGAGQALPAGIDEYVQDVTIPGDGIAHLGNQTISWYADPTSDGTEMTIAISVPFSDWTSLRLIGLAHGTNTYGTGNIDNPTTGSQIEIWQTQDGEYKRVGTLTLPTLDEEYAKRRPYGTSDRYWTAFSLPISGTLEQGDADLKIVAGENPDGYDDFEVKNLQLVYAGVGMPTLPGSIA